MSACWPSAKVVVTAGGHCVFTEQTEKKKNMATEIVSPAAKFHLLSLTFTLLCNAGHADICEHILTEASQTLF